MSKCIKNVTRAISEKVQRIKNLERSHAKTHVDNSSYMKMLSSVIQCGAH